MPVLICGSFAYDNILVFQDRFRNHILPDKIHILNVSFLVPTMRREFGGTAGNIAYNLKLLGGDPLPMGTVGSDFGPYAEWLDRNGIPRSYVRELPGHFTAQAFITTDLDDNQITAFHPGAMSEAHCQKVHDVREPIDWGIVSPDGKWAMLEHARQFHERRIPFIFDPGQSLPLFSGPEILEMIELASVLTLNDYEWQLVQEKTGRSPEELQGLVDAVVVTLGEEGSTIYTKGERIPIGPVQPRRVLDPTGCGDAYRAGLLLGLTKGLGWETAGRIAGTMGSFKVESSGGQNHSFTLDEFKTRMKAAFGHAF